ncbi:MAG TPA: hypothetical protein VNG29_03135, partial [Candidatus Paceibacterota bacterium]|nr:hypothetical protein [Candidatus Paceibacterota bacterium]
DRERAEQLKNLRLPCGSAKLPLLVNWLNLIIFAVCTIFFSTIFYFLKKNDGCDARLLRCKTHLESIFSRDTGRDA